MRLMAWLMKMDVLKLSAFLVLLIASIMATWISSPHIIFFFSSTLPQFFNFLQSWLTPPFFFLAVNLIVFLIYYFSNDKFDRGEDHQFTNKLSNSASTISTAKINNHTKNSKIDGVEKIKILDPFVVPKEDTIEKVSHSDPVVPDTKTPTEVAVAPPSFSEMSDEVSDDSCVTTEGDGEENDSDSMDAMWHAIMSSRKLNKSTTWEKTLERTTVAAAADADAGGATKAEEMKKEMRKSRTYREGRQRDKAKNDAGWRGREALLEGHEELNKKFDNFIKKSYEQMRKS